MTGGRQAGFVFVEAMAALAVVAMAVGLMFTVLADGIGRSRSAETKRMGLLVAQSRLAAIGGEIPLRTGTASGVEGGFVWQVGLSPYRTGASRSAAGDLFLVTVSVRPRAGSVNTVELRSLRLAPPG